MATFSTGEGGAGEPLRQFIDVGRGQKVSAITFGTGEPEAVLLHGRGQNAFTWIGVARAFGKAMLAIDLPGHGHSDWREDHDYGPWPNAEAVAIVIDRLASDAEVVVGMSLGGMTNIRLAARYPGLVRRAVVIDTTPPAKPEGRPTLTAEQRGAVALLEGPTVFNSFEEMLETTAATMPGRTADSLRNGVLRNSRQLDDGRWAWRYDPQRAGGGSPADRTLVWEDVSAIRAPLMLVRSGRSGRVTDDDVAEFVRRQPDTRVEVVEDAGHSVQSDQPLKLARLIEDFLATTP